MAKVMQLEQLHENYNSIDFECDDKPLKVAYEDEHILIVNKPVNMLVHPDDKSKRGT